MIELRQSDLQRLVALVGEVPHKYAVPILTLLNELAQAQQMRAAGTIDQQRSRRRRLTKTNGTTHAEPPCP